MKVCIFWGKNTHQGAWDNLLSAYGVRDERLYVAVLAGYDSVIPPDTRTTGSAIIIENAEQLPPGELVVASPPVANQLPGKVSLHGFVHPEDPIYVFGADNISLAPWMFGSRAIDHTVYIPHGPGELNSITAAAMVLYDRSYKQ